MRNIARKRTHANRDKGAGGFLLWIAVYATFMLVLIAFGGGTHLLAQHQPARPIVIASNR